MGNYFSGSGQKPEPRVIQASPSLIPPALELVFSQRSVETFDGLPYPLESTRLILRLGDGRLVLSIAAAQKESARQESARQESARQESARQESARQESARQEYSLVGGISKSIAPGETVFSDFRPPIDTRYIVDGEQIWPEFQGLVRVESPLRGLVRECDEELTGGHAARGSIDWFLARVTNGHWTSVTVTKHDAVTNKPFRTYVCLACATLTEAEVGRLNADIAHYPQREHKEFVAVDWRIEGGRIIVALPAGGRLRHYDEHVVFGTFAADVLELMASDEIDRL